MAIKPKDNEAFYREVDEELRKEQLTSYWQRYAWAIIAGIILLLAAIGGFIWWQNQQQAEAGRHGEMLLETFEDLQANKVENVDQRLNQLIEEGSPGYRAAALLTKANMAVEKGDEAAATAIFKSIAEDGEFADPYRNLALIRQTALEYDSLQPQAVIDRLKPLAQAGNPWFGSAGEMVAIAYLKLNKPELAAPIFAALAKEEALPETIRSRAVQMAGALGVDAVEEAPALAEQAGATKETSQ